MQFVGPRGTFRVLVVGRAPRVGMGIGKGGRGEGGRGRGERGEGKGERGEG